MEYRRYKILFCTPALYSAGGVERVVSIKASYFAEHFGYEVTIIVTEGKGRVSYFPISEKVNVINIKLDFEELWKLPFWRKTLSYIQKQRRYKRLLTEQLERIRPDFTISTLRREVNFISSIRDGSFKMGELHVNRANYRRFNQKDSNILKMLFAHFWMKSLLGHLKKLDKMIVLTDTALNDWPELKNVIKISDPLPFRINGNSTLSMKRIISIGRYAYDKGNDLLLHAWSKVERQLPEWTLDIYGNGERKPYENMMRQLGIDSSRCHLYGTVMDVKKEYLTSSIFVLPSRFEGFGLVLVEAMACGVPVISFDCENGPRSIISDGVEGFLIPTFDIDAFADKIVLLTKDVNLRKQMGANAQKSAEQYDMEKIGLQWKKLFDDLMGNR